MASPIWQVECSITNRRFYKTKYASNIILDLTDNKCYIIDTCDKRDADFYIDEGYIKIVTTMSIFALGQVHNLFDAMSTKFRKT